MRIGEGPIAAARQRAEFFDPQPVREAAKPHGGGSVAAVRMDAQSMEGEMIEYARLGMQRGLLQNKETIHGAGILNGAGRHALMRYANAMADGNITWMTDGSHGQPLGQPQFTGEFFAEYRALPEIGMARLEGLRRSGGRVVRRQRTPATSMWSIGPAGRSTSSCSSARRRN